MDDDPGIGGSGYALDELAEYLDRGRRPRIAAIEDNAQCQATLGALARLRDLSGELIADEARAGGEPDDHWYDGILGAISREFRAGRDLDYPSEAGTSLTITEGALRELVRSAGDSVTGVLVGRARIAVDTDGSARVEVTATAPADRSLPRVAEKVRASIRDALARHAPYPVQGVDVTIVDVHAPEGADE